MPPFVSIWPGGRNDRQRTPPNRGNADGLTLSVLSPAIVGDRASFR
jgi:hypothetical protein